MKKQLLRGALTLALLGSLFLNVLLYRELKKWYINFNLVRRDPLSLGAFGGNEGPRETEQPLVVFFGDSRAAAWTSPELEGFAFANRGVNGHTTAQALLRFDTHVTPLKPDVLVLQVGINDLVGLPLFPEQQDKIVADTQANIETIVRRARALGSTIVLTTIFPTGAIPLQRVPFWSPAIEQAIADVNDHLRSLAGEGVLILETGPVLAGEDEQVRATFAADALHLNERGYEALNDPLSNLLLAISQQ